MNRKQRRADKKASPKKTPVLGASDVTTETEELGDLVDSQNQLNIKKYKQQFYHARDLFLQGDYGDSADILKELLKLRPDDTGVLKLLAAVSDKIKNFEAAILFYQAAIERDPGDYDSQVSIGILLIRKDEIDEGISLIEDILKNHAKDLDPIMEAEGYEALGNTYMLLGDKDLGEKHLKKACDLKPDSVDYLFNYTTQTKSIKDLDNKYFKRLREIEEKDLCKDNPDDNAILHYSLFDCYDAIKEHEKAFDHVLKGAEIKRKSSVEHDAEHVSALYQAVIHYFDQNLMDTHEMKGVDSDKPVFVLGMPRSGTTLLERILLSHPDIGGVGEDALIGHLIRNYSFMDFYKDRVYPLRSNRENRDYMPTEIIGEKYTAYIERKCPSAKRVINKAMGNVFWTGYLHIAMPNARFIHIKRNAMDSCISSFSKHFVDNAQSFSYDLAELGDYYKHYTMYLEHWNALFPEKILNIHYEDIVDDLEGQARQAIDFLGLKWDKACLAFHKAEGTVRTASATQVRQPIYKSAVGRWKRYGPKVIPLIEALQEAAPEEAIEYLKVYKQKNPD
ncbi:MAG: sulfotransferase [Micavibrio sp.]|nr:MAG: sulfotransferase [Micavibrio sp.]